MSKYRWLVIAEDMTEWKDKLSKDKEDREEAKRVDEVVRKMRTFR